METVEAHIDQLKVHFKDMNAASRRRVIRTLKDCHEICSGQEYEARIKTREAFEKRMRGLFAKTDIPCMMQDGNVFTVKLMHGTEFEIFFNRKSLTIELQWFDKIQHCHMRIKRNWTVPKKIHPDAFNKIFREKCSSIYNEMITGEVVEG
jgi:hypothetical protein